STATASVDAVSREVALPADEILHHATKLLGHPDDAEAAEHLRTIIDRVRAIKQSIRSVGDTLAPPRPANPRDAARAAKLQGRRVLVIDADERVRRCAHEM